MSGRGPRPNLPPRRGTVSADAPTAPAPSDGGGALRQPPPRPPPARPPRSGTVSGDEPPSSSASSPSAMAPSRPPREGSAAPSADGDEPRAQAPVRPPPRASSGTVGRAAAPGHSSTGALGRPGGPPPRPSGGPPAVPPHSRATLVLAGGGAGGARSMSALPIPGAAGAAGASPNRAPAPAAVRSASAGAEGSEGAPASSVGVVGGSGALFKESSEFDKLAGKAQSQKRMAKRELVSLSTESILESSIASDAGLLEGGARSSMSATAAAEATAAQLETEREFLRLDMAYGVFRQKAKKLAEDVRRLDVTEHSRYIKNNQMLAEQLLHIARLPSVASDVEPLLGRALDTYTDILAALNKLAPDRRSTDEFVAFLTDTLDRDLGKQVKAMNSKLSRDRERYDKAVAKVAGMRTKDSTKALVLFQAERDLGVTKMAYELALHEAHTLVLVIEKKVTCDFLDALLQYFERKAQDYAAANAQIERYVEYFGQMVQSSYSGMGAAREAQSLRQMEQMQEMDRDKEQQGLVLLRLLDDQTLWDTLQRVLGDSSLTRPHSCSDPQFLQLLSTIKNRYNDIASFLIQKQCRTLQIDLASAIARLERGRHEDEFIKAK